MYLLNREKIRAQERPRDRARNAKRRIEKAQRIPLGANMNKINEIYKNCPVGHHVDHIIPLKGKEVSGLHVENNLQYLPILDNLYKSNILIESML